MQENRLVRAMGAKQATLTYDPMGRLWEVDGTAAGGTITRFLYDGDALVAEYDGSGNLTDRYVHGVGADVPTQWYEGSAVNSSTRHHLFANWQGSIALITDASGTTVNINAYDAYGIANETNIGRFQYTGQIAIPELGLYHYKARVYSPTLGRFLQTDPIGYEDQVNLYAYVGNDPVNNVDPTGMCYMATKQCEQALEVFVDIATEAIEAINDFVENRDDMMEENLIGNDKDFHCRANCEASARGGFGEIVAESLSDLREDTDDLRKGPNPEDRAEDQAANRFGRQAGREARQSSAESLSSEDAAKICEASCAPFAPDRSVLEEKKR